MNKIKAFFKNFERNSCILLLALILIILTWQIIGRYIFKNTPEWSEELARYLFIWLIFFGAGYAAKENAHIRIEAFNNFWPKAVRKYVTLAGELLWVAFNLIILYQSGVYTYGVFASKQISVAVKINMGWAYLGIPAGYALMIIRIIINIVKGKIYNITTVEN